MVREDGGQECCLQAPVSFEWFAASAAKEVPEPGPCGRAQPGTPLGCALDGRAEARDEALARPDVHAQLDLRRGLLDYVRGILVF